MRQLSADFVMKKAQRSRLSTKFRRHLGKARVVCLDIPDDYAFMDPALIQLLKARLARHLPEINAMA